MVTGHSCLSGRVVACRTPPSPSCLAADGWLAASGAKRGRQKETTDWDEEGNALSLMQGLLVHGLLELFLQKSTRTYRLLPVHTLVEVLKFQLALLLGALLANAMGTLDPILLKNMAACRRLVGLRPTLCQYPAVQANAQPLVQVHKGHGDANGEGLEKTTAKISWIEAWHKSVDKLADFCWKKSQYSSENERKKKVILWALWLILLVTFSRMLSLYFFGL